MAEPQPPTIHEGADPEDDPPFPPKSAEDLKTAAALSSLDNRGADDDEDGASAAKSQVDQEALGKAMSRLEVGGKNKGVDGAGGKGKGEEEMVKRRGVKVDQGDVGLLVSFLVCGLFVLGCKEIKQRANEGLGAG